MPDDGQVDYFGKGFLILTPKGSNYLAGQISIDSWGGAADTAYTPSVETMTPNQEYHIVYTHDSDLQQQFLYLNGYEVGSWVSPDGRVVDPSTSTWKNYFIGRSNFYSNAFYNGSVNELNLYDHVLSSADARNNHFSGPQEVPEPTTLAMICGAFGCLGMIAAHRRRRQGVKS